MTWPVHKLLAAMKKGRYPNFGGVPRQEAMALLEQAPPEANIEQFFWHKHETDTWRACWDLEISEAGEHRWIRGEMPPDEEDEPDPPGKEAFHAAGFRDWDDCAWEIWQESRRQALEEAASLCDQAAPLIAGLIRSGKP